MIINSLNGKYKLITCLIIFTIISLVICISLYGAEHRKPYLLPHKAELVIEEVLQEIREHPEREIPYDKLRALGLAYLGDGAEVTAHRMYSDLLYDTNPRVRERVLPWLRCQTDHVFLMLSDPNERVRAAAVTCYNDYYNLSGDWLEKACNDTSELVRKAALKRKSGPVDTSLVFTASVSAEEGPFRAILKCSPSVFHPKEKAILTFEINNTSEELQTLPAGAQVIFSTMPTIMYEFVVPYTHTIILSSSIIIQPGGKHILNIPVSSLIMEEAEILGTNPGIWTITAVCLPGKPEDSSAKPGWNIHTLSEHALCSASIKIECAEDFGVAFDKAFKQTNEQTWQPPRHEELLRFLDLGKSKRLVDELFKRTYRLIEPHNTTTAWRYWIDWNYYIIMPYERDESDEDWIISGTPQLRRGQLPPVPENIPISDWVNAEGSLLLIIEPVRDEFPVGQPVDIRITLHNVDRCPLEVYQPLSRYGENELFSMKLCSENERWTELGERPSNRSNSTAEFVQRNHPGPGYSYSSLTYSGNEFAFVNEQAKVYISKISDSMSNKDTQKIVLEPGQSYSFITSIGGLDAHRPVGHSMQPGLYRIAFSYTKWHSWIFSNTSTIKITKKIS